MNDAERSVYFAISKLSKWENKGGIENHYTSHDAVQTEFPIPSYRSGADDWADTVLMIIGA
jgi:hypothetical protein